MNGRPGLHVEFDSEETIDHFQNKEWTDLRAAVDSDNQALTVSARPASIEESGEVENALEAVVRKLTPTQQREIKHARATAVAVPAVHRLPAGTRARRLTASPAVPRIAPRRAIKAGPATQKARRDAAELRVLCAASHDAPAGLPPGICHSVGNQR